MKASPVSGFSKKTKAEKIAWLASQYLNTDAAASDTLKTYWHTNVKLQKLHDDFIENTLSNYYLPFGIAPNFLIDNVLYAIPMVIEESSVVAAASNAAKFWLERGGFQTTVISTQKNGQVHFNFFGIVSDLQDFFLKSKPLLIDSISGIQKNMKKRGGGLIDISLVDSTDDLKGYFQLHCSFETLDAMGANFINSCLEQIATTFETLAKDHQAFKSSNKFPEVVMSILSNFVPECLVRAQVSCPVDKMEQGEMDGNTFTQKFVRAIDIAKTETRRAVTHNKGIMNGVDAVILATGNDFRAVEAGVHAYAAKDGHYSSLTHAEVKDGVFYFWMDVPLALGTVGGLTSLHPLVKLSFDILQKPNAQQLMKIVAVAGLAQNFAAIRSLVTSGIQKGHMKMHLMNILNSLDSTVAEKEKAVEHFKSNPVSHRAAVEFIHQLRK
jgi:hydroxymethylglutaryl-CoA reductase